jgi:DNA (cytosine-5)-methyltransferase 1
VKEARVYTFADAFAGVGGFHAALSDLGGSCAWACENDSVAAAVYFNNWGVDALRDITVEAPADGLVTVPTHDVFTGGFPCQPFSKSGRQQGMEEARGTLFYNIARVLESQRPSVVILENVRNVAGPRHRHEWDVIIQTLRDLGYRVSDHPAVMSPHLLPPGLGGGPQVRERVFITATYVGDQPDAGSLLGHELPPLLEAKPVAGWDPKSWRIEDWLAAPGTPEERRLRRKYGLTDDEKLVLAVWNDFLKTVAVNEKLPGFPIWADDLRPRPTGGFDARLPAWKLNFLEKNAAFFERHATAITEWKSRWGQLRELSPSRRKFEWQAGDTKRDVYNCVIQLRPSGVRVKAATYLPAFVAITQTSIIGPRRRRISPDEAARVQGLPASFSFGEQSDKYSYKQIGNGVHVGVVKHVMRAHVERDQAWIPRRIVEAVLGRTSSRGLTSDDRAAVV